MPTIADLLVEQGRVLADVRRRKGERAGAIVTSLGDIPAAIIDDRERQRERALAERRQAEADQRAADENRRQNEEAARQQQAFDLAKAAPEQKRQAVLGWMKQHAADLKPEEAQQMQSILELPGGADHLIDHLTKAPAPYTLSPGEQRRGANNEILAENPIAPKPVTYGQPQPMMIGGKRQLVRAGSDNKLYDMQGQVVSGAVEPDQPPMTPYQQAELALKQGEDTAVNLTPSGLDQAAQRYLKDGTLPPMGMGKQGAALRTKILNRAAELDPNANIALNKAGYRADSTSLAALQKQRDAISSFENTAGKNIDIFLEQAKHVVDTGSPLLNRPVRELTGKVLGSPNQAAYDAARLVAINEVAKITSNPNLTGQLSDAARHEVAAFNPESATLKQTIAVFKVLKQDMANRAKSMDDTLAEIRKRMGGGAAPTGKIRARDPKGVLHEADAGTPLPAGWTLEK